MDRTLKKWSGRGDCNKGHLGLEQRARCFLQRASGFAAKGTWASCKGHGVHCKGHLSLAKRELLLLLHCWRWVKRSIVSLSMSSARRRSFRRRGIETFLKSARRGACGVVYFRLETSSLEHDDVVMVMDGIFSERVMSNLSFNLHLIVWWLLT